MTSPVIAIGLDSAEPRVIEKWLDSGKLPLMNRVREEGTYGRLENFDGFSAETPWTTFISGCSPKTTGYWSPLKFVEGTYGVKTLAAYDYQEYPPFYANPDLRVAIFDVPQVRPDKRVNGIQVGAWGAHSPQVPQSSIPEGLYDEIISKYGPHPALHRDYAVCVDLKTTLALEPTLKTGIERRGAVCHDLLKKEPWDLFMTVFGEAHSAGHNFWHMSQPEHPLYEHFSKKVSHDPMLASFEAMDTAMDNILKAAPDDANIVIFSAHGMQPNTMDLPSATFLPEFMYRFSFPGKTALLAGEYGTPVPPHITQMEHSYWERHVWNTKSDSTALQKFLRKVVHNRLIKYLEPFFEDVSGTKDLMPPVTLASRSRVVAFEPASWYVPLWPQMKAFALPSFSEGYIRINLKGREPQGIVDPEDYDALCNEIIDKLKTLKCARTGVTMVRDAIRTRDSGADRDPKRPDADIVILWQEDYASDVCESPEFGRIGPAPHYRSGSHRPEGFIMASGPNVHSNGESFYGHALDIAPTILSLMNAPIPEHLEGKPLEFAQQASATHG